jgi:HAD superfamily hydrolase (TIGR01458 family)
MAITCPCCGREYDATLFEFGRSVCCDCGRKFDLSQGHLLMKQQPIEGVLIDIAGVLYVGEDPIRGAADALQRLAESELPIRYVTNTTRTTRVRLMARLHQMGFEIESSSLFTAPIATLKYVVRHQLRPYLLVHRNLREEFADVDRDQPNAVVVGDAADVFNYQTLNEAFRVLIDGGQLIAMGNNRFFREKDGLSLDMGPFVEALRFASGVEPTIIGKPSASFFQEALDDMAVSAARAVMIGDDLENDIGGAQAHGIRGMLVRTGKYRPCDESHETIKPHRVVGTIVEAVDEILAISTRGL